ncbi:MAG: hypothetical protein KAS23_10610 [Anaerohalosphaera sp.]|nr:hypothetical protein [Anaerohalosphaera sp.]
MNNEIARDLGEQPVAEIMQKANLDRHDVVAASPDQITHKMVARACKGRRLTDNSKRKILRAINAATEKEFAMRDLFNY